MNTKIVLVCALSGVLLVGCQSAEDQISEKIAEDMINSATDGLVDVDIEDLEAGKINLTTEDGVISIDGSSEGEGTFKMVDSSGKTLIEASEADNKVTITDDTGKTVTASAGESEERPEGAPAELPSLDGASEFSVLNYGAMDTLSFAVSSANAKETCEKQIGLVEGAGWGADPDFSAFESEESVLKSYLKDGKKMVLSCNVDGDKVNVSMSSNEI